jgi:hypothetical protein
VDQPIDSIHKALEQVKRFSKNGGEYWMGRDIQPILGYATWDKFLNVISRAMMAVRERRRTIILIGTPAT